MVSDSLCYNRCTQGYDKTAKVYKLLYYITIMLLPTHTYTSSTSILFMLFFIFLINIY